jgi:hypothetical protein
LGLRKTASVEKMESNNIRGTGEKKRKRKYKRRTETEEHL